MDNSKNLDIDPRQRRAAAILLLAVNAPQPLREFAEQTMFVGKRVYPGMTIDEVPNFHENSRAEYLRIARDLVDEMLAELDGVTIAS